MLLFVEYLACGLAQHLTSPYSSPLMAIPNKCGGVRMILNYSTKAQQVHHFGQLSIFRASEVLDPLGKYENFSLFDLVSLCYQILAHQYIIPMFAFSTAIKLYEWLTLPQENIAAPRWSVTGISEVVKCLKLVTACLDNVIVFNADIDSRATSILELFQQLQKHNLNLLLAQPQLAAIEDCFFGRFVAPFDVLLVRTHILPPLQKRDKTPDDPRAFWAMTSSAYSICVPTRSSLDYEGLAFACLFPHGHYADTASTGGILLVSKYG